MEKEQPKKDFWIALYEYLEAAQKTLPYGEEPEYLAHPYPDGEHKELAERDANEEKYSADTDDLISVLCEKRQWPKKSKSAARFYADKRIKWAKNIVRMFAQPWSETGDTVLPRPKIDGFQFIKWMLTEGYCNRFLPPPKVPFTIYGCDGGRAHMIWT
jgi:hypothetical protein